MHLPQMLVIHNSLLPLSADTNKALATYVLSAFAGIIRMIGRIQLPT
jgi:hypothetical protein